MTNRIPKTVQQIAAEYECSPRTVANWCQHDGQVSHVGEGRGKQWLIYPEDEKRFKARSRPGRPWPKEK